MLFIKIFLRLWLTAFAVGVASMLWLFVWATIG